ncbi:class I SAM-dependent methyltransferase [Hellea balneolensis]|uniref:class I SAM-dependent methyltransferase n=1 Tax=Hellea balneolensis TaxID=287478 RepID=UPI0003FB76EC|nr:class I SAM-dependent methyltransferase [Hellea balneolensis]
MTNTNAKNWDNYWQGRASQQSGNALIEVGIERNHELKKFWTKVFSNEVKSTKVIDFACGAGSVLEHANNLGFSDLSGLDVSEKALEVMSQKIAGAKTICAPVNLTGLESEAYDLAVSQFGIEYAGDKDSLFKAFKEIYRTLRFGGKIVIIAHTTDGVIMEGCLASLKQINLIKESGFIERSQQVFTALKEPSEKTNGEAFYELTQKLNDTAQPIMEWLKSYPELEAEKTKNEFMRFAYHLLESSHRLITHHTNYSETDALNWFEGMKEELEAYKGRMLSMTKAALSSQDISDLKEKLAAEYGPSKLDFEELKTLHFNSNTKPAAWVIRASKP